MAKTLIHLTNKYPYGTGENFTENELRHFSAVFDNVLVIPLSLDDDLIETVPRRVPSNVEVFSEVSPLQQVRQNRRISISEGRNLIFSVLSSCRQISSLFKNPKHFLYDSWFDLQRDSIYPVVKSWLAGRKELVDISGNDISIYSTWFHLNAAVAVKIRDEFFGGNVKYLVSRAHRYDLYAENGPRNYLPARTWLLNKLDKVFPVSEDGVQYLKAAYPEYSSKVEVRRLGSNPPTHGLTPVQKPLHIFSCSWVKRVKRLDLLILALKELEEQNVDFHWFHIGNGEEEFFEQTLALAGKNLSKDKYTFLGQIPNSEIIDTYEKYGVSVLVNVSSSEGVPVSLMEATSVGIPIVATDVGGSRELFQGTMFDGLLSSDPSPAEVAGKLIDLSKLQSDRYQEFCIGTQKSWNDHWNAETNLRAFAVELLEGKSN